MTEDVIVRRLSLIKHLYRVGLEKAALPETISFTSILLLHDAIDMFMNLAAEKKGIKKGSNIKITCDITLPFSLSDISQFINHYENLVPYRPGNKVDMDDFLVKAEAQKIKIADTLKKIQDSPNLIFTAGQGHMQPLFSLIENQLNEIHREALVMENCYNTIVAEGIMVEKKYCPAFYIQYSEAPKFLFTTNFTMSGDTVHSLRRQKTLELKPYFSLLHTVEKEFGHVFFEDWDKEEWIKFNNLFFLFVKNYLKNGVGSIEKTENL